MSIVTAVLLVRQSSFDSATLLRSLGYSVALSVRTAQVYGSSVVGTTTSSSNCTSGFYSSGGSCFASAYGVYFSASSPSNYTLFADLNGNGQYDTGEAIQVYQLGTGYQIKTICATTIIGGTVYCPGGGITWVSIVFRRPNPDACFATNLAANACAPGPGNNPTYSSAYIQLTNTGGNASSTRSITVSQTGEIAVGVAGT